MPQGEQSASVTLPSHSYESLNDFCKLEGRSTEEVLVAAIKFYVGKHRIKSRAQVIKLLTRQGQPPASKQAFMLSSIALCNQSTFPPGSNPKTLLAMMGI